MQPYMLFSFQNIILMPARTNTISESLKLDIFEWIDIVKKKYFTIQVGAIYYTSGTYASSRCGLYLFPLIFSD